MAKEALDELINFGLGDFVQIFCKQLYENTSTSNTPNFLRYDLLLHNLSQFLEDQINLNSRNHPLLKLKQSISLFLAESKAEGEEMVEEWKREGECKLRAGEILLILNKVK